MKLPHLATLTKNVFISFFYNAYKNQIWEKERLTQTDFILEEDGDDAITSSGDQYLWIYLQFYKSYNSQTWQD